MGSTCTNCLNSQSKKPDALMVNTSCEEEEDKENGTLCVIENIKESIGKTNTISIFQGKIEKELPQITILPQVQSFNTLNNYKWCSNNIQSYIEMYHQRFLNRVISQTVKLNEDEDLDPVSCL